jgi:hypothetical protein
MLKKKVISFVDAVGGNWNDYIQTLSPNFQDGNNGTLSLFSFAQQNPIYSIDGNQGAGLNLELSASNAIGSSFLTNGLVEGSNGTFLFTPRVVWLSNLIQTINKIWWITPPSRLAKKGLTFSRATVVIDKDVC